MLLDLQEKIAQERYRRDVALRRLECCTEATVDSVSSSLSAKLKGATPSGFVKGMIRTSPFAACFAAVGAGALVARLMSRSSSTVNSGEPQRVVVEVQAAGGTAVPTAPPAPAINPLELLMQGMTVFAAVKRSLADLPPGFFGGGEPEPHADEAQNAPTENPV